MVVIINLLIKKLETIRDIECIRNKYNDLDHPWIINFPETIFEETYIINRLTFLIYVWPLMRCNITILNTKILLAIQESFDRKRGRILCYLKSKGRNRRFLVAMIKCDTTVEESSAERGKTSQNGEFHRRNSDQTS